MCVHWYLAEHSSELSYRLFSKSKGRILDDELRYSFTRLTFPSDFFNLKFMFPAAVIELRKST